MEYKEIFLTERWFSLEDLPNEQWKDIKGYEGMYQISSWGRVKSLGRYYYRNNNIISYINTHIMSLNLTGRGTKRYYAVHFNYNGARKSIKVHRLVAIYFISNPYDYPCVNHKNEDKTDNRVDNLEWCTYSYNNTYNGIKERTRHKRIYENPLSFKVLQYDKDGILQNTFPSISEASRQTGYSLKGIRESCKRNKVALDLGNTRKGSLWKLA